MKVAMSVARPGALGGASAQRATATGNYLLAPPTNAGRVTKSVPPNVLSSSKSDGRICVRHREFIGDVQGQTGSAMHVTNHYVNPGLKSTFPWLGSLASLYESYQFRYLRFEYVGTVGTSHGGSVIMAVDYDAADALPVNKSELMQFHSAVRGPVWAPTLSYVCSKQDLSRFGVQRFVRRTDLAANLDIKTYDIGRLVLGVVTGLPTVEVPDPVNVGELYVEYEVELITPHPDIDVPYDYCAECASAGALTGQNFFGNAPIVQTGQKVVEAVGNNLKFLVPGQYKIDHRLQGTGVLAGIADRFVETGAATTKGLEQLVLPDGSKASGSWAANVTEAPCEITLNWAPLLTTLTSASTWVTPGKYSVLG